MYSAQTGGRLCPGYTSKCNRYTQWEDTDNNQIGMSGKGYGENLSRKKKESSKGLE